jgi:hypothetical protein
MSTMQYRPVAAFAGPDRQIVHLSLVPLLPGVDALCGSPVYELNRSVPAASGPHLAHRSATSFRPRSSRRRH